MSARIVLRLEVITVCVRVVVCVSGDVLMIFRILVSKNRDRKFHISPIFTNGSMYFTQPLAPAFSVSHQYHMTLHCGVGRI